MLNAEVIYYHTKPVNTLLRYSMWLPHLHRKFTWPSYELSQHSAYLQLPNSTSVFYELKQDIIKGCSLRRKTVFHYILRDAQAAEKFFIGTKKHKLFVTIRVVSYLSAALHVQLWMRHGSCGFFFSSIGPLVSEIACFWSKCLKFGQFWCFDTGNER